MKHAHPYSELPPEAFYRTAIAERNMFEIDKLWLPKFKLETHHKVSTYGSCFAQHIGKALKQRGYLFYNTERAPSSFTNDQEIAFNYGIFSCRTGNIYTTSMLEQWIHWGLLDETPPSEVWSDRGRVYDPFRPNIEPNGFASEEEMLKSRYQTQRSFRRTILDSDVFIFTLGLTECWANKAGYEYPVCPGVLAGQYNKENHLFINQDYISVFQALERSIQLMRQANERLHIILTVSPVPLAATYSGQHVLPATQYSKSVLRSVAGRMSQTLDYVDYFPSYEIISSPPFRGTFFRPDQRHVTAQGVSLVMNNFFADHGAATVTPLKTMAPSDSEQIEAACEEELLAAFAREGST